MPERRLKVNDLVVQAETLEAFRVASLEKLAKILHSIDREIRTSTYEQMSGHQTGEKKAKWGGLRNFFSTYSPDS